MNRAERVGQNEAFFRHVNERVRDVNAAFSELTGTGDFICECGDASCVERVRLSMEAYRTLRSDPTTFAVVPGHELPDVESVVERNDGYNVVQKHAGDPAELARETAP